jgi:hypothetical protein
MVLRRALTLAFTSFYGLFSSEQRTEPKDIRWRIARLHAQT